MLTQADDVVGTVAYMSPEQAEGSEADMRSDIYALGATAYELATGRVPFEGRDMFQVMMGHLSRAPTPPADVVPDFPPAANAFILRCLAKRPEARFQSMAEVLTMLQSSASPDAAAALPPPVPAAHLETTMVSDSDASPPRPAPFSSPPPRRPDFDEAPTGYFFRPVQQSLIGTQVGGALLQTEQVPVAVPSPVAPSSTVRTPPVSVTTPQPVAGQHDAGVSRQRADHRRPRVRAPGRSNVARHPRGVHRQRHHRRGVHHLLHRAWPTEAPGGGGPSGCVVIGG